MQKTPSTQDQAFPIGHYPANLLKLDMEIIHSGVLCLPGNRDRNGRALILATTENAVWESPRCSSTQLASILTYYYAISKKEVQNEGFRILLDARERQPAAALRRALHVFQKTVHGGIHSILVLAAKESSVNTEVLPGVQTETLTSIRSLHKYVEPAQLTPSFAGGFLYSNEKWVRYRLRLESLLYACRTSVHFLRRTSDQLEAKQLPNSAKEIPALIEEDEMLMGQVLQDARLIGLQQEGAAILVKLKRETISICGSDSYMPDLDVTCALYNQVDEELHRLVQISNRRQRDLEKLARFWRFEDQYRQVSEWLRDVGEPGLDKCEMVGDSLPVLRTKQREFQDLNHVALGYCQKADVLLGDMVHWESGASPQLQSFADKLHGYRTQLADFTRRAEQSRLSIDRAIRQHNAEDNGTPDSSRTPARASTDPRLPLGPRQEEGRPHPQTAGPRVGETHRGTDQEGEPGIGRAPRDRVEPPLPAHSSSTPDVRQCSSLAWGSPLLPPPPQSRCPLKKTRSFDLARQLTPHTPAAGGGAFSQRALSEPGDGRTSSRGGAGVLIRGLEVSSTELADRTCSPKEHVMLGRPRAVLADSPWGSSPPLEQQAKGSKARWVLAEALAAEQDYVCCLEHVVGSYSPEMERPDVPQELRGKRALVFGNLDKLLAFHQQLLLPQLWACLEQPLGIGDCFLRHKEHFAMYALYIRNKPQSDALLARHGSAFFKRRQLCLGDRMDLGSYLQMPIRRMMRYVALLQDLMAESSTENAQDVRSLRAALEMVQFQLRHGDNLVAMDAIRECDVNLKEQGQLLRRDRFTVWCGRRKSVRQVFLFEQLIVFTKVKRVDGGPETYVCKSSLKTADVGLTENIGESGLRFEVWYRRRRSNETYVFQAETADVKQAWTRDIAQILWRQASRNKELRLQEMLSTGMGSKLGLDCLGTADAMHWPPADCAPTEKEKITSE